MNELLLRAGEDPWSLALAERQSLSLELKQAQQAWLPLLKELVEPPGPGENFPAFLLETPNFGELRKAIACQNQDPEMPPVLDTATADTLQRFVDLFRHYLQQVDGPEGVER